MDQHNAHKILVLIEKTSFIGGFSRENKGVKVLEASRSKGPSTEAWIQNWIKVNGQELWSIWKKNYDRSDCESEVQCSGISLWWQVQQPIDIKQPMYNSAIDESFMVTHRCFLGSSFLEGDRVKFVSGYYKIMATSKFRQESCDLFCFFSIWMSRSCSKWDVWNLYWQ